MALTTSHIVGCAQQICIEQQWGHWSRCNSAPRSFRVARKHSRPFQDGTVILLLEHGILSPLLPNYRLSYSPTELSKTEPNPNPKERAKSESPPVSLPEAIAGGCPGRSFRIREDLPSRRIVKNQKSREKGQGESGGRRREVYSLLH